MNRDLASPSTVLFTQFVFLEKSASAFAISWQIWHHKSINQGDVWLLISAWSLLYDYLCSKNNLSKDQFMLIMLYPNSTVPFTIHEGLWTKYVWFCRKEASRFCKDALGCHVAKEELWSHFIEASSLCSIQIFGMVNTK